MRFVNPPLTEVGFDLLYSTAIDYANEGINIACASLSNSYLESPEDWQKYTGTWFRGRGRLPATLSPGTKPGRVVVRTGERHFVAEPKKTQAELASTRAAVLDDVLHERGKSWLAELEKRRSSVYHLLRHHETNYEHNTDHNACKTCDERYDVHLANCDYAELLRIVGGPEETQAGR